MEKEKQIHPEANPVIRLVRRFLPLTGEMHGHHFTARLDGVLHLTPLMIVLLVLETTDVLFAVDSVPAVFGVTKEPLVVYTSNVFAILGLRSLYFLLSGAMDRFHALKYGLAFVLVFVGLKMVWLDDLAGGHFPVGISLAIISTAIGVSIAVSQIFPRTAAGQPHCPNRNGVIRRILGGLCVALGTLSLLVAFGAGRTLLPLPLSQVARSEWFFASGVCYAICGWLLLRASPQ